MPRQRRSRGWPEPRPSSEILESIRRTFALDGLTLWHRDARDWVVDAEVGAHAERGEDDGPRGRGHALALVGPAVPDDERRLLDAFVAELAGSIHIEELEADASEADDLERVNDLRLAILSAVSHDLRTPLAGIKASVTSLLDDEIDWPEADREEFLATIDAEADRLDGLVGNLLDMSRLQTGALQVSASPIGLDEIVPAALRSIGPRAATIDVDVGETLPRVVADPGLLERAIANVVANALVHGDGAAGADRRRGSRRWRRPPRRRPRPGRPDGRARAHLRAVPAARGQPAGGKRRARARGGTRLRRGNGRLGRGRGHAGRRADRRPATAGGDVTRILVVDDEPQILRALAANLKARGYAVDLAGTGEAALTLAQRHRPDAVILDLGLPGMDGLEVIEGLRGWTDVPIVVLSVREREAEKVAALDAGADDYVTKPFGMGELLARVRAALRRSAPGEAEAVVETEHFRIDLAAKRVTDASGEDVRLTPTEWGIVEILARHPGMLVSQRQLLREVWGPQYATETNYLRVYLAQIRRKLEPDPARPRYFITEPRMGYRFEVPDRRPTAGG